MTPLGRDQARADGQPVGILIGAQIGWRAVPSLIMVFAAGIAWTAT